MQQLSLQDLMQQLPLQDLMQQLPLQDLMQQLPLQDLMQQLPLNIPAVQIYTDSNIFFKSSLYCFLQWCVKKNQCRAV